MTVARIRRSTLAWVVVALAGLVLLAAACETDDPDDEVVDEPDPDPEIEEEPEPADDEPDHVDQLRMAGREGGFPTPYAFRRGPGSIMAGWTFDELLWIDSTGEPIPWLAEDWEVSDDGLEWTFTLHDDITWHDGEPMTADDVAFTFEYNTEGAGGDAGGGRNLDVVDDVVAVDDSTVVFELPEPYAPFEDRIATSMKIVPEHIWADVDDPGEFRDDEARIGTGPYQLEDIEEAEGAYLFEANDDFHLGTPHVRRLELVPADDELLALEQGEIDVAEPFDVALPDDQVLELEEDPRLQPVFGEGDTTQSLYFNLDAGFPYDEQDFRHAIAYALDRQDMVDRILLGRGEPGSPGNLAPGHPMVPDDLPDYSHDLDQAEELLDGLGLDETDDDGMRMLDGETFQPQFLVAGRFGPDIGEVAREQLLEAGLDVQVEALDAAVADEHTEEGDYEMAHIGYGGVSGDPDLLRPRFAAPHIEDGDRTAAVGYDNPEVNELADAQLSAVDPDEREELVADLQREIAEDLPVLSLFVIQRLTVFDREVFDAYYHTPTCSPCFGSRNKHMLVTGQQEGF